MADDEHSHFMSLRSGDTVSEVKKQTQYSDASYQPSEAIYRWNLKLNPPPPPLPGPPINPHPTHTTPHHPTATNAPPTGKNVRGT